MLSARASRAIQPGLSPDVPSVENQRRRARMRAARAAVLFAAITGVALLLLDVLPDKLHVAIAAIVVVPAVLCWLWAYPIGGLFALLAAALLLETQFPAVIYADDIGHAVPFFEDLATWTGVKGLSVSVAEIFMLLVLLVWFLKAIATRTLRFDRGSLMRPIGLYMLMVLVAEVHGIGSGGDFKTSLWEIRSQVYMFVVYVLGSNLIKSRRHIDAVVWILIIGIGAKGIQGTWRYLITLHRNIQGIEAIFPHEQSFFYNVFIVLTPILFIYGGSRRMKRVALSLLPFVIIASLANQRRAAILALAVALIGMLLLTALTYPRRRRAIAWTVLALAIVLPPYYIAYNGKQGLLAEPARAVASAFTPDQRDTASNTYRINEDKDIMATVKLSPIIGYGFGKPMIVPYPLADISNIYAFWNIMPHDSILWVWMRLGTIGYVLLWIMIGTAIIQATQIARRLTDPYLKGLAVFIVLIIIQQIIFGYLDLQWVNYRNLIALGLVFALIAKLGALAPAEHARRVSMNDLLGTVPLVIARRGAHIPQSAAIVDGRLQGRRNSRPRGCVPEAERL